MHYGWIASLNEFISRSTASKLNSKPAEAYRALARLPCARNHVQVVYKYFKYEYEATAIANELYGYYIAKSLRLPICRSIAICACDKRLLTVPSLCMEGRDPGSEWFKGVATTDESPNGILTFPNAHSSRIIAAELRRWEYLPQAAVFDGLVANQDRNSGNVYLIGQGKFVLIDHADILGGQGWDLGTLEQRMSDITIPNYLASFVAEGALKDVQDRMMSYAVELSRCHPITPQEVGIDSSVLDEQCGLASGTTEKVFEILSRRQARLPEALFYYMQHADLFN